MLFIGYFYNFIELIYSFAISQSRLIFCIANANSKVSTESESFNAIAILHQQMDDDKDGVIDYNETTGVTLHEFYFKI